MPVRPRLLKVETWYRCTVVHIVSSIDKEFRRLSAGLQNWLLWFYCCTVQVSVGFMYKIVVLCSCLSIADSRGCRHGGSIVRHWLCNPSTCSVWARRGTPVANCGRPESSCRGWVDRWWHNRGKLGQRQFPWTIVPMQATIAVWSADISLRCALKVQQMIM
jgi:hypothetical protein